ncbi:MULTISPECIES: hypothetical protein [Variovorax]|uniref:Uncharacterized protein n=1 Tax=Variovorax paradoxus TaxID=34073 RepID=A0AA91DQ50_VARPD|nr:hypothetical protein [Variovorax paradoxus]OAK63619.1 hypothetical protein A3K87_16160 [Variovorax paradoxus]
MFSDERKRAFLRGKCVSSTTRRLTQVVGLMLVAGLAGCADFFQQHRDFHDGWRTGEIVEIGRANEIRRSHRTDCRNMASADELAAARFATLIDRSTGQRHAHVVILDAVTSVNVGDTVSTNVVRWGTPIRVLSHAGAPSG